MDQVDELALKVSQELLGSAPLLGGATLSCIFRDKPRIIGIGEADFAPVYGVAVAKAEPVLRAGFAQYALAEWNLDLETAKHAGCRLEFEVRSGAQTVRVGGELEAAGIVIPKAWRAFYFKPGECCPSVDDFSRQLAGKVVELATYLGSQLAERVDLVPTGPGAW